MRQAERVDRATTLAVKHHARTAARHLSDAIDRLERFGPGDHVDRHIRMALVAVAEAGIENLGHEEMGQ